MPAESRLYGVMAEFATAAGLVEAARCAREAGYRRLDAFTPFPVEAVETILDPRADLLPYIALAGAVVGGVGSYALQYYLQVVDYPINVGGRPLHAWPAFLVTSIVLMLVTAAFATVVGMLALDRLPQLHHPVFNDPRFARASQDRFFLCIEATDPAFDPDRAESFLEDLGPLSVARVER